MYGESTAPATSLPEFRVTEDPSFRRTDAAVLIVLSVLDASPLASRHAHPLPSLPLAAHRTNHARTGPQTATQNFLLTPPVTVHPTIPYYYGAVRTHPDCATPTPTPHQPTPAGQPAHEPHPAIRPRGERRAEPSCRNAGSGHREASETQRNT